jgi:hypothetical protein
MCSGKTYNARYLVNGGSFVKIALADKLKAIAYDLYGLEGKDGHSRALLQGLGDDLRKWDEDVFIKTVLRKVQAIENQRYPPRIVVDDVRFVNEASAFLNAGFTLVHVICEEHERLRRIQELYPNTNMESLNHTSEQQVDKITEMFGWSYWITSNEPSDVVQLEKLFI